MAPGRDAAGKWVHADSLVRADTSVDKLAKLQPVFAKDGTLTAGNSSPLTDGAAAVLLMSEDKASALGFDAAAPRFRSWSYVGVDPADQLLMGPALAMPRRSSAPGMRSPTMDLVDMHEAFAAQVLCVLKMLASDAFARERLGRERAVGEVDPARLNVHGGSLALGHPFGATGARMVTTMANELARGTSRRPCSASARRAASARRRCSNACNFGSKNPPVTPEPRGGIIDDPTR